MSPLFRKKIAAYRAQKLEAYRANPAWVRAVLSLTDQKPLLEGPPWGMLWAIGIELPPQEFLNPAAVFCTEFLYFMIVVGGPLAGLTAYWTVSDPIRYARILIMTSCVGFVLLAIAVSATATLTALSSRRKLGFGTWEEFEPFDEPYGPSLKEILATQRYVTAGAHESALEVTTTSPRCSP